MSVAIGIEPARPREEAPQPLTRQPLFLRFWAGQTISVFGDQISALAIPLTAILALHASALEVGLLTAMAWLPHLLFSLPAGVWIDRRAHRRWNMIVVDVLRAAALATIPVAWWLGALTMWQLVAVAFAVGALTVFFDLSSASFFVALVHRSQYVDANSKSQHDPLAVVHRRAFDRRPPRAGAHRAGRDRSPTHSRSSSRRSHCAESR